MEIEFLSKFDLNIIWNEKNDSIKKNVNEKKEGTLIKQRELFIFYLYTSSFQGLIISFSTFCFNEIFQFKYGPKERKNGEEQ